MTAPWSEADRCVGWAVAFVALGTLWVWADAHWASILAFLAFGFAADAVRRTPAIARQP